MIVLALLLFCAVYLLQIFGQAWRASVVNLGGRVVDPLNQSKWGGNSLKDIRYSHAKAVTENLDIRLCHVRRFDYRLPDRGRPVSHFLSLAC